MQNRTYTLERNQSEILTFDLDIFAWEAYCATMNADPNTLLTPYQNDIKVLRKGQYLFGVQIVDVVFDLASDFSQLSTGYDGGQAPLSSLLHVTATGYLDLFKDRYITATYVSQDGAFVAGDLITQTQAQVRGSVGVTLNTSLYMTGALQSPTYSQSNIKTEIQNLSNLPGGRFDFAFSPFKEFQTYAQIGAVRTDVQFTYGGPTGNVIGLQLERTALSMYNRIIGLGSGLGPDQLSSIQDDVVSQTANYIREDIKQYNNDVDQGVLDSHAQADLALESSLLAIPQITITGNEVPAQFLGIGDRIPVSVAVHPSLSFVNGIYRTEKMVVTLDDNDFESSIVLYFDNFAVGA